jgi:hypothetical protein
MDTEHILLESDDREVPELRAARKVHAHLLFRSRLRNRTLQLDIIDYYYLSARMWRARSLVSEYVLDLRFIDPSLRLSRHIAWRWMTATLALATLVAVGVWRIHLSSAPWWQHDWLPLCATMLGLTVCTGLTCLYRTTETLALYSVHGQARFLEFTGGLGMLRVIRPFIVKLAAHIRVAIAARRSSRAEHLRDEMREHFRLKQAGVLPTEEYEASKRRILARHDPA